MSTRPSLLTPVALSCLLLSGLTLAALGCSGQNEPRSDSTTLAKAKAAQALSAGPRRSDPCADNGWYSDGECDSFCAEADADCDASEQPVACTLIAEVSNGVCGRPASDPCRSQDPDCVDDGGSAPGDGVQCTLLLELPDGVCSRPASDPCQGQDPDCVDGAGDPGDGVVCALFIELPDGVCSRPANDPCQSQDPDCVAGAAPGCDPHPTEPVVCALFIEQPDGICSRPANDPCIAQDPDCNRPSSAGQ